jgi:hypothetical protein
MVVIRIIKTRGVLHKFVFGFWKILCSKLSNCSSIIPWWRIL